MIILITIRVRVTVIDVAVLLRSHSQHLITLSEVLELLDFERVFDKDVLHVIREQVYLVLLELEPAEILFRSDFKFQIVELHFVPQVMSCPTHYFLAFL